MQKIIAANWKMHKSPKEAGLFISELGGLIQNPRCKIIICIPFIDVSVAVSASEKADIKIGAQNCHWEDSGAFTGEISAEMLKDSGVEYVIIGHSERRTLFGETDEIINKKVVKALDCRLKVILCVGETLEQRENEIEKQVVSDQIKQALSSVKIENIKNIIVAYEPVWAIGTGKNVTALQADDMCKFIRELVANMYGIEPSNPLSVIYGGSMNEKNANELLSQKNVDGGLIGGASLIAFKFSKIIKIAGKIS